MSQKMTWPVVKAVDPALTVAVSATGVPEATVVTGEPADVSVRAVEVAGDAVRTVRASCNEATSVPDVPVTVMVEVPGVAELLAVSVSELVASVGLGESEAVTPLGRPETAKLTLPLKPFCGTTAKVELAEPPGTSPIWLGAL